MLLVQTEHNADNISLKKGAETALLGSRFQKNGTLGEPFPENSWKHLPSFKVDILVSHQNISSSNLNVYHHFDTLGVWYTLIQYIPQYQTDTFFTLANLWDFMRDWDNLMGSGNKNKQQYVGFLILSKFF